MFLNYFQINVVKLLLKYYIILSKVTPWMFEGIQLHRWSDLTHAIN